MAVGGFGPSAHHNPVLIGVVFLGGAAGTWLRWWLEAQYGAPLGSFPTATLLINVGGALMLGVLLGALAAMGPDAGPRRTLRLGLGTGLCGGLTTYSTFMVEAVELLRAGHLGLAAVYGLGSVVAGLAVAAVGVGLGRLWARHRSTEGAQ